MQQKSSGPLYGKGGAVFYTAAQQRHLCTVPSYHFIYYWSQHFLRSPRNLPLIFFSFSQKFKKFEWIFNFSMEEELDLLHFIQQQFCFKHCTFSNIINFLRAMLLPYQGQLLYGNELLYSRGGRRCFSSSILGLLQPSWLEF